MVVMPERRSFPQGRDGDRLHALAMNAVFDKEFGCSIQVRAGGPQGRCLGASDAAARAQQMTSRAPSPHSQNGEYRKKLNYMGLFNDWLDRAGCVP